MAISADTLDLSIVIVNWNSLEYLRECLHSVHDTASDIRYEIIVVDNLSSDGSRDALAGSEFSGIRVLMPERNLGFVRANNLGAAVARGTHLLFLNPDTVVLPGALQRMIEALASDERLGIVGCRLLNRDLSLQTSCVQPLPTITNQVFSLDMLRSRFPTLPLWGIGVLYEEDQHVTRPVEVVSGACLMIRRRLFEDLCGFSRDYFMYAEEVDLCFSAARRGWIVGHVGSATVIHYGGQSSGQSSTNAFGPVLMANSVFTFLRKTRGRSYAFSYRACLLFSALARLIMLGMRSYRIKCLRGTPSYLMSATKSKWLGISRWAIGLETWTTKIAIEADRMQNQ